MLDDDSKLLPRLAIPVCVAVSFVVLARYFGLRGSPRRSKLPYPPGPKGLPLIGNILDLPRGIPVWEGFAQMAETYRTSTVPRSGEELMTEILNRDGYHVF